MAHDAATVQRWLTRICGHEGGFQKSPTDDGNWTGGRQGLGELKGTKWGVAANTYGHLDIERLTVADAERIYRTDFLAHLNADAQPDGVAFQMLDFAVNSGPSAAVAALRSATTKPGRSESDVIMLVLAERLEYLTKLRRWDEFGRGWVRRQAANLRYGAEDS